MTHYMPTEEEIERIMRLFNFDRLVAIRHLQGKQMARELAEQQAARAERERCAKWLEAEGRHDMAFGIRRAMHCGPNAAAEEQ